MRTSIRETRTRGSKRKCGFNVVEFLIMDREFPRSIHFCIRSASESLQAITGSSQGYFKYRTEQLMGRLRAELDFATAESAIRTGLHEYLDGLQDRMNQIDNSLREDFVTRTLHEPGRA
jgi:uncharacterized alpha-E superfamily protein